MQLSAGVYQLLPPYDTASLLSIICNVPNMSQRGTKKMTREKTLDITLQIACSPLFRTTAASSTHISISNNKPNQHKTRAFHSNVPRVSGTHISALQVYGLSPKLGEKNTHPNTRKNYPPKATYNTKQAPQNRLPRRQRRFNTNLHHTQHRRYHCPHERCLTTTTTTPIQPRRPLPNVLSIIHGDTKNRQT